MSEFALNPSGGRSGPLRMPPVIEAWRAGVPGLTARDKISQLLQKFPTLPPDEVILQKFPKEDRAVITYRLKVLSSVACYMGKDFGVAVHPNLPDGGWYWDTVKNEIRADSRDLADLPLDACRFILGHEGAHRRISRIDVLSPHLKEVPGFFLLNNCIEDPRVNNFILDAYSIFRGPLISSFSEKSLKQLLEGSAEDSGFMPESVVCGLEYVYRWYEENTGRKLPARKLPPNVVAVVEKTLPAARRAWSIYPSKSESEEGEQTIRRYHAASAAIIEKEIWPEYKKLVAGDFSNQLVQELLQQMGNEMAGAQGGEQPGGDESTENGDSLPGPVTGQVEKKLSKEQMEQIKKAIREAQEKAAENEKFKEAMDSFLSGQKDDDDECDGSGISLNSDDTGEFVWDSDKKGGDQQNGPGNQTGLSHGPIDERVGISLDSLGPKLNLTLKQIIESFEPKYKEPLLRRSVKELRRTHEPLEKSLEAQLDKPQTGNFEKSNRLPMLYTGGGGGDPEPRSNNSIPLSPDAGEGRGKIRLDHPVWLGPREDILVDMKRLEGGELGVYESARTQIADILNKLENDLRAVFRERRIRRWISGRPSGPSIDLQKRISEIARDVPVFKTRSFEKREDPSEKDYAISLLVDLSGSMRGTKIKETFLATIALVEVLGRLSIKTEILGFNDRIYEYKPFHLSMSDDVRESMGGMINETCSGRAMWNDDGWALAETSKRLAKQSAKEKFLLVLSDGCPEPSGRHAGPEFALSRVIEEIRKTTDQKLVGLGLGPDTQHVSSYYPNSMANMAIQELATGIADFLRKVIKEYNSFKR